LGGERSCPPGERARLLRSVDPAPSSRGLRRRSVCALGQRAPADTCRLCPGMSRDRLHHEQLLLSDHI
jgi:hypothetical protein